MRALKMKTKVFGVSHNASTRTEFESMIDGEENLRCNSTGEDSPFGGFRGLGNTRFVMVLPCDAKQLETEGKQFIDYLGVLQRLIDVKFSLEVTSGSMGTRQVEIPENQVLGWHKAEDQRFIIQCVAQLRPRRKGSETRFMNCVGWSKFSLLSQEITQFCPEEAWVAALQGYTEAKRSFCPSIGSKNILLLFWIQEKGTCSVSSSLLFAPEELKVDLHPSFTLTMEECAQQAMMDLLGNSLTEDYEGPVQQPLGKVSDFSACKPFSSIF